MSATITLADWLESLERAWHGKTLDSINEAASQAYHSWCAAGQPGTRDEAVRRSLELAAPHVPQDAGLDLPMAVARRNVPALGSQERGAFCSIPVKGLL